MTVMEKIEKVMTKNPAFESQIRKLRAIILKTELEETYKWQFPVYTLDGKNVVGLGVFKHHFGIWFFQGALLKDKSKKLMNAQEGKTEAMRQWRFDEGDPIDEKLILLYLKEAIENQKAGKAIKPKRSRKERFPLPEELQKKLNESTDLLKAYSGLTPGQQNDYHEYVHEAKRMNTKLSRIEKIIPMILAGKGLNDRYRK